MKKRLLISILGILVLLSVSGIAREQNLFVLDMGRSGNIYEYTPSGVRSLFASGLNFPQDMAINSFGDLFVTEGFSLPQLIIEFSPGGKNIIFASDTNIYGNALTFNSAGDPFEANPASGNIYEFNIRN